MKFSKKDFKPQTKNKWKKKSIKHSYPLLVTLICGTAHR